MLDEENKINEALEAEKKHNTAVEEANDYLEHFDILETITNVGNDEVFTPRKTCDMMLDSLPEEVWHNPLYKWLNPATKNGIFEREIAIRLDKGLENVIPDKEERRKHILQNMIYSIGQTKFTANVARRTLYYCSQANRKCDGVKAPDGHYVNGYSIGNGTWFDDEEGNIKTPCTDHYYVDGSGKRMSSTCTGDARKKYKCKYCGIAGDSKYNSANQREKYAYEFIHFDRGLSADIHLGKRFFGGQKNMKFDIIIGNPPYQLNDGGAQASARPIYHLFINQARFLKPKYLCMIVPSRWMAGGKGLDDFRESMLKDKHVRILHDFINPKDCFPNNDIKGGVCFFLWNGLEEGACKIYKHHDNMVDYSERYLKEEGLDIFIRDERLLPIIRKIKAKKLPSFSNIVSTRKPYGLAGDFFKNQEKYGLPSVLDSKPEDGFTIYGLDDHLQRTTKFISKNYPLPKNEGLLQYKFFVSESYGAGIFGELPSDAIIGNKGDLCTETFLQIGPFQSETERNNCVKFWKTKFFRACVSAKKITQHCTKDIYELVPMVDLNREWTDKDLFEFFNLSEEEANFILNNVQEMK